MEGNVLLEKSSDRRRGLLVSFDESTIKVCETEERLDVLYAFSDGQSRTSASFLQSLSIPRGETTNPRNRPCSERTRIFPVSPTGDVPGVSDDLANVLDVLLSVVGDDEDVVQVYDYWHIQVLP